MNETGTIPAVTKTLDLDCSAERAFDAFTRQLSTWWPLASHSCFLDPTARVEFDAFEGGHVWEVRRDGERAKWGEILDWRPPHGFAMTWHPGTDPANATRLRVRFEAITPSLCRLHLVHDGWEARAANAFPSRDSYDAGWDVVLSGYPARAVTRKTG
jgi:uncharacterized protein YndB with AHSA1/START domain